MFCQLFLEFLGFTQNIPEGTGIDTVVSLSKTTLMIQISNQVASPKELQKIKEGIRTGNSE
jgi:hypothetical protein